MATDILIVDDESDIRKLVAGILSDEGYDTRTAKKFRRGAGGDRSASPWAGVLRHLDAGLDSGWIAAAELG